MPRQPVSDPTLSDGSERPSAGDVKFLFVVVEAPVFEDELVNRVPRQADRWGNFMPPSTWLGFGSEQEASEVFMYRNGTVTKSAGYEWYRPGGPGYPGRIGKWDFAALDENGWPTPVFIACQPHTTRTIFDGGAFLGTLIQTRDASVDPYLESGECRAYNVESSPDNSSDSGFDSEADDPGMSVIDTSGGLNMRHSRVKSSNNRNWLPMKFVHDAGTSRISLYHGDRCVAGHSPSWVPSIVNPQYATQNAPNRSRGLGGDMATIIGLLALTQKPYHGGEAFAEEHWRRHKWHGTRHPKACGYALVIS